MFNTCLSEYCTNIELKVKVLKTQRNKYQNIYSRYDLSEFSLCEKPNNSAYHKRECVERQCKHCSTGRLRTIKPSRKITWKHWESKTYSKDNEKKVRKILKLKSESVEAFMKEMAAEVIVLASNCMFLRGNTRQHDQFSTFIKDVPKQWIVFCMAFAKNIEMNHSPFTGTIHGLHSYIQSVQKIAKFRLLSGHLLGNSCSLD